jgi:peptidoglycan/LPS O-acetylase OafA/YrhL
MFGERWFWDVRAISFGTLTSIMYLTYIPLLMHGNGWGKRFLASPIFLKLATLGYGIYLVHMPLFDAAVLPLARRMFVKVGMSMALVWPISLALLWLFSAMLAYVLHILIEKPALWLRDRFAG